MPLDKLQPGAIIELEGRRYATQSGLAWTLGVTPRTLARWSERRIGPPKIKVGKLVLYDLTKLHAWLERHEQGAIGPGPENGSAAREGGFLPL